jgi:peptide deformylase
MVKEIVKDVEFLTKQSEKFIFGEDDHIIQDLIDTANAHKDNCAGLAAVQIGYLKRVIVVKMDDTFVPFINPRIIQKFGERYIAVEGCLSIEGEREVKRNKMVRVAYTNESGKERVVPFKGYVAEIIQHEVDHLNGVLI